MKKVLVLAAAIALLATPAFAGIQNTKHDLSTGSASKVGDGTIDQICVYCHTPHGADISVTNAPLWNRTNVTASTSLYAGLDLQATAAGYSQAGINASDAPLCLSCHAGDGIAQALKNPPNSGLAVPTSSAIAAAAYLSDDMSNDHPVGFNYEAVGIADTEIYDITTARGNGVKFFPGTAGKQMWCSSCHDVHSNDVGAPFLLKSNVNSGLCLACHEK